MPFGKPSNRDCLLPAERPTDDDRVASPDVAVGLRGGTVDVNLAPAAGFLRFGACLEQTRDIKPDVETLALIRHVNIVNSKAAVVQLRIAG
jgi:hypothetical protein